MRILQISDTHISEVCGQFMDNVAAMGRLVAAAGADVIVNTGDLSMNGAIFPEELDIAARWHTRLGSVVLTVPGNHDVGDSSAIRPDQALNDDRLFQFRTRVGADRWVHDAGGWRLIGLNAMLFGTGHPEESVQFEWLAQALESALPVAIFLHKPLFIDTPDEGPRGYWTIVPDRRRRLLDLFASADIRLVASGHLHIARMLRLDGVDHVWCPASSFVVGTMQEDLGGERRIGGVIHDFSDTGVTSRFVSPADAEDRPLDPLHDVIYPPFARQPA